MYNNITIIGTVTRDPLFFNSKTDNSIALCSFSVETTEEWEDKQTGVMRSFKQWHSVKVFSKPMIAYIQKNLKAQSIVIVIGKMQYSKYTTKENIEKNEAVIMITGFNHQVIVLNNMQDNNDDEGYDYLKIAEFYDGCDQVDKDTDIPF